jgi:lysophospholipase L1-like esterase
LIPVKTERFADSLNESTVFLGDSITQLWLLPIHNAGIGGHHTSEIFSRFRQDALSHGYARVVLLTGTNDIWSENGQMDQVVPEIGAMAAMARAAGVEPALCQLPPMLNSPTFNADVIALNAMIAELSRANGYLLVDYYTPMAEHPEYFVDGVHPNAAGYAAMEAALAAVVKQ